MHTPGRSQLIVARKDLVDGGQLKSYADLKGKTIARPAPYINAEVEQIFRQAGCYAESGSGVLAIGENEVDAMFADEVFELVTNDGPPGTPKNIAYKEDAHAILMVTRRFCGISHVNDTSTATQRGGFVNELSRMQNDCSFSSSVSPCERSD